MLVISRIGNLRYRFFPPVPELDPSRYDSYISMKQGEFEATRGREVREKRETKFGRIPESKKPFQDGSILRGIEDLMQKEEFELYKRRNIDALAQRLSLLDAPRSGDLLPDYYIVCFDENAFPFYTEDSTKGTIKLVSVEGNTLDKEAFRMVEQAGGNLLCNWNLAVPGFAAFLPPDALDLLKKDPSIKDISPMTFGEADVDQYTGAFSTPHGIVDAGWGRNRIDENNLSDEGIYRYHSTGTGGVYSYDAVHVYVFDSGIRATHAEFNQGSGWTTIGTGHSFYTPTTEDFYSHGTGMAGAIAGSTFGIAKQVILHPIKMSTDYGGSLPVAFIESVDWVLQNLHQPGDLAVANVSWGYESSPTAINAAVQSMIDAGILVVCSAGNEGTTVFKYPALSPGAITVGASGVDDGNEIILPISNYGPDVDVFAPGSNIQSAGIENDYDDSFLDGTSLSAAFVSGIAARYLQTYPLSTPADFRSWILNTANSDKITGSLNGSPNKLAFKEWWYPLSTREEWMNSDVPFTDDYWFYSNVLNSWVWTGNHLYSQGSDDLSVFVAAESKWLWYCSPETLEGTGWNRYWVFYDFSVSQYLIIAPVSIEIPSPYSYWSFYLPWL